MNPDSQKLGRARRRRQTGIAALEFAIILPLLIATIAFPIFFARYFMHYSVAQKAAHDAAVFLSTLPANESSNPRILGGAQQLAEGIANETIAELRPGSLLYPIYVDALCDNLSCGIRVPQEIRVSVRMMMVDQFFTPWTQAILGDGGLYLQADVTMPYVGR